MKNLLLEFLKFNSESNKHIIIDNTALCELVGKDFTYFLPIVGVYIDDIMPHYYGLTIRGKKIIKDLNIKT